MSLPTGWESRSNTIPVEELSDRASVQVKVELKRKDVRSDGDRDALSREKFLNMALEDDPWKGRQNTYTTKQLMQMSSATSIAVGEVHMKEGEKDLPFLPPPPEQAPLSAVRLDAFMDSVVARLSGIERSLSQLSERAEKMENQMEVLMNAQMALLSQNKAGAS